MNESFKLLLSLSLSGSILSVLVFAIKPFIKQKLSKSIQYYIWIVVLLRFILPFSFEASIMNELFYGNQTSMVASSQDTVQKSGSTNENRINPSILPSAQESISNKIYKANSNYNKYFINIFNQYVLYIWLLGLIITLTFNLSGYMRFLKYLKQENKIASDKENQILGELLKPHPQFCINSFGNKFRLPLIKDGRLETSKILLKGRNNIRLVRNHFVPTPMLIGILKPCIIIPDTPFTEKQFKNILLHEISHLKHFDIAIKWLTMIITSIHWFNPLMYFIKKEINHACELACDEAVIKNLTAIEKQAYGDTLISVVAERKYPIGVLQATMCEEKKNLKERLIAIMNYNKKSNLIITFSVILLGLVIFTSLYLGAGVGKDKNNPPNLYICAENEKTKVACIGTYSWSYHGIRIQADSDHAKNFKYISSNIVSVTGKQQLVIGTQKLKSDKGYDFTIEQISVYKDGQLIEFETPKPSFMNGELYVMAPPDAGEYIYTLRLNFKNRGTVNYGFVVRVDMLTYDLNEISKCKTPYIGNHVKVLSIVGQLPVPDKYFRQQYISMVTDKKPYKLSVFYESRKGVSNSSEGSTLSNNIPYSYLEKNALVLFCMIDNLDEVTFRFRDSQSDDKLDESKYNDGSTFKRAALEEKYGNLSVLGNNLDLLQDILGKNNSK